MKILQLRNRPPRKIQAICGIGAVVTLVAIGVSVTILQEGTTSAYLIGGTMLGLGTLQAVLLVGLWRLSERAWQATLTLYTIALMLNILLQSLPGMILDTAIIAVLLGVQTEYRDLETSASAEADS